MKIVIEPSSAPRSALQKGPVEAGAQDVSASQSPGALIEIAR